MANFGSLKKIASYVLLVILLLHLAGFYIYFAIHLGELRTAIRHHLKTLPESELVAIRMPASDFRTPWLSDMEMKWQGKMYDISRIERQAGQVVVLCLPDEAEDNLLAFLSKIIRVASDDKSQAPATVIQLFTLEFVLAPAPSRLFAIVGRLTLATPCDERLLDTSCPPDSPPPRV